MVFPSRSIPRSFRTRGLNLGATPKILIYLSQRVWWTISSAGWEPSSCLVIVKQIDQRAVAVAGRPLQEMMERVSPSPPPRRRAGMQMGRKPQMENTTPADNSPQVGVDTQAGETGNPPLPLGQRHSRLLKEKGRMEQQLPFLSVLG